MVSLVGCHVRSDSNVRSESKVVALQLLFASLWQLQLLLYNCQLIALSAYLDCLVLSEGAEGGAMSLLRKLHLHKHLPPVVAPVVQVGMSAARKCSGSLCTDIAVEMQATM